MPPVEYHPNELEAVPESYSGRLAVTGLAQINPAATVRIGSLAVVGYGCALVCTTGCDNTAGTVGTSGIEPCMNVALVLGICWLPGLAIAAAIGLRGWTLAAASPVLSFGSAALATVVVGKLGVAWTLLSFTLWTLAACAGLFGMAKLLARRNGTPRPSAAGDVRQDDHRRTRRDHLLIAGGVIVGIGVGIVTFLRGIGNLRQVAQDWDAPYHANLIRWIAENDTAAPSAAAAVAGSPDATGFFYPDAYHALLALTLGKAGLGMPELLNLAVLAMIVAIPLGVAALASAWGMPRLAVAAAAAVSTWFTAFPYDSLVRGPLWPYVAGVALVPAVLAMARHLVESSGPAGVVGVAAGTAGLVGLHTSLGFVVAIYLLLLLVAVLVKLEPIDWRVARPRLIAVVVLGGLLSAPLMLPALQVAANTAEVNWPSQSSVAEAFGQMVTFSPDAHFPQWWLGLPALAGVVLLVVHRRMVWMAAAFLVLGGLYAATVSMESTLIHILTIPFYNDHWRVGALVPLAGVIAFGEFAATTGEHVAGWIRRRRPAWDPARVAPISVAVLGVVLAFLSNGAYIGRNSSRLAEGMPDVHGYASDHTVSAGERKAFAWLREHVDEGERVMNGVYDGTVWMYALSGVQPVVWTFRGPPRGGSARLLTERLDQLDDKGPLRAALNALNVRYVVMGDGFVRDWYERTDGMRMLEYNPNFAIAYRNADAVVYRIKGQHDVPTSAEQAKASSGTP